jgi:SAM-dependent methyltransferase
MNRSTKDFMRKFVPPIVLELKTKLAQNSQKPRSVSLGKNPDKQDLDLYWDEEYANTLEGWGKGTVWTEIELLFATLKGKVVDIACGTGPTIEILNKNPNLEVYGFDISDVLINRANKKGIPIERLKVADATKRIYNKDEFNYSFSIGSIEHFTENGIDLFLENSAYYTKDYCFHMLPVNKDGINKGWEKYDQSYFNNSVEWWLPFFHKHFSEVIVLNSTWVGADLIGKWFVCKK